MEQTEQESLLELAVINQIEKDIEEDEFESLSQLLQQLFQLEGAKKCLEDYLSDDIKEEWLSGEMRIKY